MKGSSFEREIAKTLTVWVSGKEKPYVFWRTPSSGAMATLSQENKEISGDIIALRPEGTFLTDRWSIELKTGYPKANFHQHLKDNKNTEIESFWKQSVRDATNAGKYPILIYRKLSYPSIIGIGEKTRNLLLEQGSLPSKRIVLFFGDFLPMVNFYDMKTFFKTVTPDMVRSIKCLE